MSYIIIPRLGKRLENFIPPVSESTQINLLIHVLDLIIKTGRYFPIISISLTGLNLYLAVNDFLANNFGFAILNSLFVVGGMIFLLQMCLKDRSLNFRSFTLSKI